MADEESDSARCTVSSPEDDPSNDFPIDHWNPDAVEGVNEANNANTGVSNEDEYASRTVRLQPAKSENVFEASDFSKFLKEDVGQENVERFEKWRDTNTWMLDVTSVEIKEKLLRMWKIKIKGEVFRINPYHDYEMRGFLHWVPHFVSDDDVKAQLVQFGKVLVLQHETHPFWNGRIKSDVRYFGLRLRDGVVKNDVPHFLKFDGYRTLVIVRGRNTACFHCRVFGHSKKKCPKYQTKLNEYCKNPTAKKPRTKRRGQRHERNDKDKKKQDEKKQDEKKQDEKKQDEKKQDEKKQDEKKQDEKKQNKKKNKKKQNKKKNKNKQAKEQQAMEQQDKEQQDKEQQDKTNPNSTSTDHAPKNSKNIESCLKHRGVGKQRVNKKKEEMLVILQSLKTWKESATKMVEEVLLETEKKLRILVSEKTETETESLTLTIKALLEEMKQITITMIDQTLNNLKSIVTHHFGLDSNEQLEKLINDFETTKKK